MSWGEITAVAALIVSMASALFVFLAPLRTERLRQGAAQHDRELAIFTVLMSERGRWGSPAMLTALNAVKVTFRESPEIIDKWFLCYSKAGSTSGSANQYYDLLGVIGTHIGIPMRREDLENFFVNPTEQQETAIKHAHVSRPFSELSANTSPPKAGP